MNYQLITYKTLIGTKEIVKIPKRKSAEWIVYKNGKPAFHVNCFDLKTESNIIMNGLVLCQQKTIQEVIKNIAKKNDVKLSIEKPPIIALKKTIETKELVLPPLPEAWLN
ncbi:hypothetical protein ACE1MK_12965 [Tenacibaculum maritimum]|uniref:hypothetical protein n=1 Tax=Tenacibaculum maritimum TaxID=107401 RepID=UPI0012E580DE|nr:hypothetical protein [Tenacibaculum maritimum]MCD9581431.1 hypothetical protein [Tenacibaculum maritimum]MCD9635745.1 hypothetical protein [Tenacibaculum maritimum]MDB0601391.1 hypothetical protein [Tenacibaculum maritimum]MDB0611811.1 hypothetical protein [Tenacibaculum maritimum]CAA0165223.1 conserved hypothetical protein [Tenacibaculum maritimum]